MTENCGRIYTTGCCGGWAYVTPHLTNSASDACCDPQYHAAGSLQGTDPDESLRLRKNIAPPSAAASLQLRMPSSLCLCSWCWNFSPCRPSTCSSAATTQLLVSCFTARGLRPRPATTPRRRRGRCSWTRGVRRPHATTHARSGWCSRPRRSEVSPPAVRQLGAVLYLLFESCRMGCLLIWIP